RNENEAYRNTVKQPIGGAASMTREARSAVTDCQPARNVEALRLALDKAAIESRPLWKPMHRQPVYADAPAYIDGTSERLFRQGLCLPAGPYVGEPELLRISDAIHAACE
ncbi:MAG: DegT/DnrJ/EryC1/StrS family aminotransferase, partial [Muribaculaceae bacterium]|nr:DegT/DnrJ/EryC1/StrS family aminotransferase [Muribaculaceae bacterium]